MKKIMLTATCIALAALTRLPAVDYTDPAGTTWKYVVNGDGVSVTIGNPLGAFAAISPAPTGSVAIPSIIDGKMVTAVGAFAFLDCSSMKSVTIPSTVTSIGWAAFNGCSSLKSIQIPYGVASIDALAFYDCRNLVDVMLPESVASIGNNAFAACRSLRTITLPSGLTYIDIDTFLDCSSLQQIAIPNGVTEIRGEAFKGCTSLQFVTFPPSLMTIGERAFEDCGSISTLSIPDSVTEIGSYAFHGCKGLKSLTVPAGLGVIGSYVFSECRGLVSLTIPSTVREIGQEAFSMCVGLTSVAIPASVTYMQLNAFSQCSRLSIASVPISLRQVVIDNRVFENTIAAVIYYDDSGDEGSSGDVPATPGSYTPPSTPTTSEPEPQPTVSGDAAGRLDPAFAKSQTVVEALYDAAGNLAGSVQIKAGKASSKGVVRVSATATLLNGKKISATAAKMEMAGDGTLGGYLAFKDPVGKMAFATAEDGTFTLTSDRYAAKNATVGGKLDAESLTFSVAVSPEPDFGSAGKLLKAALPNEVKFAVKGGTKWSFAKTPTIRYVKNGAGEYVLSGLDDEQKTNVSALKLTYTASTGVFRGSFKVYSTNADAVAKGKAPKIKKYNVTVTGMMVDGSGEGIATCKKPATQPWKVTVSK